MRRQRLSWAPQDCAVLQDGLSLPLLLSDISNRVVFEVLGWVPALSAVVRQSWRVFNSASFSVSCFFCICIPNKQEIMFICMQMCLSLRLGFWIKSFTVPLISNYTQALTWVPPPGRGVSSLPSKHVSVSLGCLVCHLWKWVGILDLIWSSDLQIDRCTTLQSPLNYLAKICKDFSVIDIWEYYQRQTWGGLGVADWQVARSVVNERQ